jgi:hypothetical protein
MYGLGSYHANVAFLNAERKQGRCFAAPREIALAKFKIRHRLNRGRLNIYYGGYDAKFKSNNGTIKT